MGQVLFCRGWVARSKKGNYYVNTSAGHSYYITQSGEKTEEYSLDLQIVPDKKFYPEKNFQKAEKELLLHAPGHMDDDLIFRIYYPENGNNRAYAELVGVVTNVSGHLGRSHTYPSFMAYLAVQPDEYSSEHRPDGWYPMLVSEKEKFEKEAWVELKKAHQEGIKKTKEIIAVADEIISGKLSGVGGFRCISGSEKKSFGRVEAWDGWCFDLIQGGGLVSCVIEVTREEYKTKTLNPSRVEAVRKIRDFALQVLMKHSWERSERRLKALLASLPYLARICPVILKKGYKYDKALKLLDKYEQRDILRV